MSPLRSLTGGGRPGSRNASPRAVVFNAFSGYVTLAMGALVGLIATPILLHNLGSTRYGLWSILIQTVGYIGLAELGLSAATTNRIAGVENRGSEAMQEVVSTAWLLFLGVATVALLASAAFCLVVPALFSVPGAIRSQARLAFLFLGGGQAVTALVTVFTAFLIGIGRMHLVNFSGASIAVVVTAAQAGAALAGADLAALGVIQLGGAVATLAVFRHQARKAFPAVEVSVRHAQRAIARELVSLGSRNAVGAVAGTLAFGSDLLLIGLLLSPAVAAGYAVALRVYALLQRLVTTAAGAVGPTHARRAALSGKHPPSDLYVLSVTVTLALALLGSLTIAPFASGLLALWLGHAPSHAAAVVVVMCAVLTLQSVGSNTAIVLISSERASEAMWITVASAITNIVISVVLTETVGVIGPAVGSLAAVAIFDVGVYTYYVCRGFGWPYIATLREAIRPLATPVAVLGAVVVVGRLLVHRGPFILVIMAVATLAYAAALSRSTTAAVIWDRLRPQKG